MLLTGPFLLCVSDGTAGMDGGKFDGKSCSFSIFAILTPAWNRWRLMGRNLDG
jgi:hypothetical protein